MSEDDCVEVPLKWYDIVIGTALVKSDGSFEAKIDVNSIAGNEFKKIFESGMADYIALAPRID